MILNESGAGTSCSLLTPISETSCPAGRAICFHCAGGFGLDVGTIRRDSFVCLFLVRLGKFAHSFGDYRKNLRPGHRRGQLRCGMEGEDDWLVRDIVNDLATMRPISVSEFLPSSAMRRRRRSVDSAMILAWFCKCMIEDLPAMGDASAAFCTEAVVLAVMS